MRRWLVLALVVSLVVTLFVPLSVFAGSTAYIDVTATGSELDITVRKVSDNATLWEAGTLSASATAETAIDWGEIINNSTQEVYVTVHGNEMVVISTGAAAWTLSATATPGDGVFGMKLGVDDDDDTFDVIIKDYDDNPYENVVLNSDNTLSAAATWNFGVKFWSPTASVGNDALVMTDLDASEHAVSDSTNGLCFTASFPT